MVLKDRYGLHITTSSGAAQQAYIEAVDAILSATGNAENALDKCLNSDPNFALAYSARARILQLRGKMPDAKLAAEKAVELAANATDRERQHAEIFKLLTNLINTKPILKTRKFKMLSKFGFTNDINKNIKEIKI